MPLIALRLAMLGLLLAAAGAVRAASVSCSASMSDLAFPAVDPFGGAVATDATLRYTCTYSCSGLIDCTNNIFTRYFISMCFNIESGASGGGNCTPRRLLSGSAAMQFQIYKDASRASSWGSDSGCAGSNVGVNMDFQPPSNGSSQGGILTAYGQVPGSQSALVPGNYSNFFSGASTKLSYRMNSDPFGGGGTYPGCGTANNGSFPFSASASVAKQCTVTATNIDFGTKGPLSAVTDATSTITAKCTNTTPYQVGLDNGSNASGSARRLRRGVASDYLGYELYRDSARSQRWGNTMDVDRVTATGSAANQNFTVYGRVPAQSTPPAGTYTDTITVTVTY